MNIPDSPADSPTDASASLDPARLLSEEQTRIGEPENALPPLSLGDLPGALQEAVARANWNSLMPVQAHALPYALSGRDLMVQARTGSGKTGAFLLPMLARLNKGADRVQALILVPTRELAVQVENEAHTLFQGTGLKAVAVYGGVGYGKQMEALREGVQVVVGTPGRILDHLLRRTLSLDYLSMLIFDEADRMLSIGFYPDMKEIQRYIKNPVSAYLFSATYPPHVLKLAGEFLADPQMLSLSQGQVHVAQVQHLYYETAPMDKDRALVRLLEVENPSAAIIFCNTKANVHYVTAVLKGFGYNAEELSADLSQAKREEVLARLRRGEVRFLVATDVAARGIDIPDLSHVILCEPPEDHESYIHRAGRTGRAGAAGTVISLVDIVQKMELARIAKHYGIDMLLRPMPDDAAVAAVVSERITALLEAELRGATGLQQERMRRFLPLAQQLAGNADQLPLLAMLFDRLYQEHLHKAPPAPTGISAKPAGQTGQAGRSGHGRPHGGPRRRRR